MSVHDPLKANRTDEQVAQILIDLAVSKSGKDTTPASVIDDIIVELVRGLRYLTNGTCVPCFQPTHGVHIAKRVYEELAKHHYLKVFDEVHAQDDGPNYEGDEPPC